MERTVFTNGCFDIIHPGHVDLLRRARALGDRLVVGINSDESVRKMKGIGRPFIDQESRKATLLGLSSVDEVQIFDELTPENLIKSINPDVLVKGGDWLPDEIIGADHVKANGGEVYSLPLLAGYSSSKIVEAIRKETDITATVSGSTIETTLDEHAETIQKLRDSHLSVVRECAELIFLTFKNGKKVLLVGNGGSAADAQHIAAEFVGRYETDRIALPAIALTTDTSSLTALANDFEFDRVFTRQIDALANEGDLLIAISTSGTSSNIIAAVMSARKHGCRILGMTGSEGKKLAGLSDACLMIPSKRTARIQEAHITVAHIWCELIDTWVSEGV